MTPMEPVVELEPINNETQVKELPATPDNIDDSESSESESECEVEWTDSGYIV